MEDKQTKNRDIMLLLEKALYMCDKMAQFKAEWKTDCVYFRRSGKTEWHSTQNNFSAELLNEIYQPAFERTSEDKKKKFCVQMRALSAGSKQEKNCLLDIELPDVRFFNYDDTRSCILNMFAENLNKSFASARNQEKLKELIRNFLRCREGLEDAGTPFPKGGLVKEYLESYYNLLVYLMINEQLLTLPDISELLSCVLRLDCDSAYVSWMAPMAQNQLYKLYRGIFEYYKRISSEEDLIRNPSLCLFYKSVILQKTQHAFRWFVSEPETGKLVHVAVPPIGNQFLQGSMKIPCRYVAACNSYEGIGELRTAEKILYEMKKWSSAKSKNGVFRIAMLGDINKTAMEQLTDYLKGVLDDWSGKARPQKVRFDIYSKNFDAEEVSSRGIFELIYYATLDELFRDKTIMGAILREHEVVFMLDCIKLYSDMDVLPLWGVEYQKQRFVFGDALDSANDEGSDVYQPDLLDELYEVMTAYSGKKVFGRFRKKANDVFLQFCEEQIAALKEDKNHTLYVYVSDLHAFDTLYCNDKVFMRTERYNQKEIGIIRYSTEMENIAIKVNDNQTNVMCFNVWQVVKHINLEKRQEIIQNIMEGDSSIYDYDLHNLYIGMDYGNWPKRIELHYAVAPGENLTDEKKALLNKFTEKFIKKILLPILNGGQKDMFQAYFWKTFYSFLYGDAKNVQEMLLIHLLKDKYDIVGYFCIAKQNQENLVLENRNRKFKYSIKRFLEMIMNEYDISANSSMDQFRTAYIIEKDKTLGGKEETFEKVRSACEKMGYTDSYLYQNCKNI